VPQVKTRIEDANSDILRLIRGLIEGDAKKLAPVDGGRLRGSITGDNDNKTAIIGTNVDYAAYQELGTGIHATKGSQAKKIPWFYKDSKGKWHKTYGNKPHPFLEPAATKNANEYARIAREVYSKL
jgi:HK97 gp10 family phage protein